MSDITNKFREEQKRFKQARNNIALEAARIRAEIHANCDENTPSRVLELFAHYQPQTDYRNPVLAQCEGCGIIYERPYTAEELGAISKEREAFQKMMRIPMTDFSK